MICKASIELLEKIDWFYWNQNSFAETAVLFSCRLLILTIIVRLLSVCRQHSFWCQTTLSRGLHIIHATKVIKNATTEMRILILMIYTCRKSKEQVKQEIRWLYLLKSYFWISYNPHKETIVNKIRWVHKLEITHIIHIFGILISAATF